MGQAPATGRISLRTNPRNFPGRSNIPEIAKFTYSLVDETCYDRAMEHQKSGFLIVGGSNYGQGSSREHAAIAPRYMGLRAVIAKSYARIHRKNLINFGMAPLYFKSDGDYDAIDQGDTLHIPDLSPDEKEMLLLGGLINRAIHKMS